MISAERLAELRKQAPYDLCGTDAQDLLALLAEARAVLAHWVDEDTGQASAGMYARARALLAVLAALGSEV